MPTLPLKVRYTPTVLMEDNHLLVLHKPAGMLSQGDDTGDESALDWGKAYIGKKYSKPGDVYLALLHRLDRPVAGILLFARTSKAASRMSVQFKDRQVQKTYLAITHNIPEVATGTLRHHLRKMPGRNLVRAYDKPGQDSQPAELTYRLLRAVGHLSLIEVKPLTGRQHQIRVQLATLNCPIVGDAKYGKDNDFLPDQSIALLAWQLSFAHPVTGTQIQLKTLPPNAAPWNLFAREDYQVKPPKP